MKLLCIVQQTKIVFFKIYSSFRTISGENQTKCLRQNSVACNETMVVLTLTKPIGKGYETQNSLVLFTDY